LPKGGTISGGYDPVMYIGTDGKLRAEWFPAGLIASTSVVDDGLWHHAALTASGGAETLSIDGQQQGTASGTPSLSFANPNNLTFGAGYIGGSWPAEPHYGQNGTTGYLDYLNGQIADITLTQ
jgi:hypothetical protein